MKTQALSFGSLAITRNPEKETIRFEFKNDQSGAVSLDNQALGSQNQVLNGYRFYKNPAGRGKMAPMFVKQNALTILKEVLGNINTGIKIRIPTAIEENLTPYVDYLKTQTELQTEVIEMQKGNVTLEAKTDQNYLSINA